MKKEIIRIVNGINNMYLENGPNITYAQATNACVKFGKTQDYDEPIYYDGVRIERQEMKNVIEIDFIATTIHDGLNIKPYIERLKMLAHYNVIEHEQPEIEMLYVLDNNYKEDEIMTKFFKKLLWGDKK